MANSPQAKKRARQAEKARLHNMSQRSTLRTAIKKTLKSVASNDAAAAQTSLKEAVTLTDKAVNKGLIHANKAARIKSRLNQKVKAIG